MKEISQKMNRKFSLKHLYFAIFSIASALAVTFRTIALFLDFDQKSGHFIDKGFIRAADIIISAGCIFLFTYVFFGGKKEKLLATFSTPHTYIPSGAVTVALLFFALVTKQKQVTNAGTSFVPNGYSDMVTGISSILIPLSVLSIGYFILNATVNDRTSSIRAFFGICAVSFMALYATYLYFDTTLAINAPNKVSDQMAYIFAALFLLYEIRISLGRECWHLYSAFGYIAAALTAYSSIPSLILYFVNGDVVSNDIHENALSLCLFIFITARLALTLKLPKDAESEIIVQLRNEARERDAIITEKEEIGRAAEIELYVRLQDIEELPEDINENEFFGITNEKDEIDPQDTETAAVSDEESEEISLEEGDTKVLDTPNVAESVAESSETGEDTEAFVSERESDIIRIISNEGTAECEAATCQEEDNTDEEAGYVEDIADKNSKTEEIANVTAEPEEIANVTAEPEEIADVTPETEETADVTAEAEENDKISAKTTEASENSDGIIEEDVRTESDEQKNPSASDEGSFVKTANEDQVHHKNDNASGTKKMSIEEAIEQLRLENEAKKLQNKN